MVVVWRSRRQRARLRRWLTRYFYSAWRPAMFCFGLLGLWLTVRALDVGAVAPSVNGAIAFGFFLGGLCAIAFIGLVVSTSWNLMNKRWAKSLLSFFLMMGFCYLLNLTIAHQFLFAADDGLMEDTYITSPSASWSTFLTASPSAISTGNTHNGIDHNRIDHNRIDHNTAATTSQAGEFTPEAADDYSIGESMESSVLKFYGHL